MPVIPSFAVYSTANVLFKRKIIERLRPDESFQMNSERFGTFVMTRADFAREFPRILNESKDYREDGSHSYSYLPECLKLFRVEPALPGDGAAGRQPRGRRAGAQDSMEWPEWEVPPRELVRGIVSKLTPFIRFLSTEVIEAVVQDNEKHRPRWSELLVERGINPAIYLWPGSPCAYPGVRRFIGRSEKLHEVARAAQAEKQAIYLDDNHMPRDVWAFTLRGARSSREGPSGFQLAHLFAHKDYNREQIQSEIKPGGNVPTKYAWAGLFISVANTVYTPNSIFRPTDLDAGVRALLQEQARRLYGNVCVLLPWDSKAIALPAWDPGEFEWAVPVGTRKDVRAFLEFRASEMESLFARTRG
jgi:hypothetical protein